MRRGAGHCRTKQARKCESRIAPTCARVDCPNRIEVLTPKEQKERFSRMFEKRLAEIAAAQR
jgi:hypothetical protein